MCECLCVPVHVWRRDWNGTQCWCVELRTTYCRTDGHCRQRMAAHRSRRCVWLYLYSQPRLAFHHPRCTPGATTTLRRRDPGTQTPLASAVCPATPLRQGSCGFRLGGGLSFNVPRSTPQVDENPASRFIESLPEDAVEWVDLSDELPPSAVDSARAPAKKRPCVGRGVMCACVVVLLTVTVYTWLRWDQVAQRP